MHSCIQGKNAKILLQGSWGPSQRPVDTNVDKKARVNAEKCL